MRGLVVAEPGRVRDGLLALLTAIREIDRVEQTDDAALALEMITRQQIDLLLLDLSSIGAGDELQTVLKQIKASSPQTRCLVLADDARQQRIAEASGADGVLIKGFTAQRFIETVRGLLRDKGRK